LQENIGEYIYRFRNKLTENIARNILKYTWRFSNSLLWIASRNWPNTSEDFEVDKCDYCKNRLEIFTWVLMNCIKKL